MFLMQTMGFYIEVSISLNTLWKLKMTDIFGFVKEPKISTLLSKSHLIEQRNLNTKMGRRGIFVWQGLN